jgi:hypothetical protein
LSNNLGLAASVWHHQYGSLSGILSMKASVW